MVHSHKQRNLHMSMLHHLLQRSAGTDPPENAASARSVALDVKGMYSEYMRNIERNTFDKCSWSGTDTRRAGHSKQYTAGSDLIGGDADSFEGGTRTAKHRRSECSKQRKRQKQQRKYKDPVHERCNRGSCTKM